MEKEYLHASFLSTEGFIPLLLELLTYPSTAFRSLHTSNSKLYEVQCLQWSLKVKFSNAQSYEILNLFCFPFKFYFKVINIAQIKMDVLKSVTDLLNYCKDRKGRLTCQQLDSQQIPRIYQHTGKNQYFYRK